MTSHSHDISVFFQSRLLVASVTRKGIFPYINSDPLTDIQWTFLLIPLWWFIGIEQIIWPLLFGWAAVKVLIRRRGNVVIVPTLNWLVVFIVIHILSGFFITESFRIVTFARNLSTYIAAAFLLFVLINSVITWRQIETLLISLISIMIVAAFVGLLGIFDLWRPQVNSVIGFVLPASISSTGYGGRIAFRTIGDLSWFVGIGEYFRVTSFFMYSTLYATCLSLTIPVVMFLNNIANRFRKKLIFGLGVSLLLVNLIFTTGRVAALSFVAGGVYFYLFVRQLGIQTRYRSIIIFFLITGIFVVMITLVVLNISLFQETFDTVVFSRGSGSVDGRLYVYLMTLQDFWKRPFLGWGTERDIPGFPYPMGSHSYYLGILYKQGSLGLGALCMTLVTLWRDTKPLRFMRNGGKLVYTISKLNRFLEYGRWVIVIVFLNSITDVLELDALTLMVMWCFFSLLIVAKRLLLSDVKYVEHPSL